MKEIDVLFYPLMGEKATLIREKSNTITFMVNPKSSKQEIKTAFEAMFKAKVVKVNTMNTMEGGKKAHITLSPKFNADEIASNIGVL